MQTLTAPFFNWRDFYTERGLLAILVSTRFIGFKVAIDILRFFVLNNDECFFFLYFVLLLANLIIFLKYLLVKILVLFFGTFDCSDLLCTFSKLEFWSNNVNNVVVGVVGRFKHYFGGIRYKSLKHSL